LIGTVAAFVLFITIIGPEYVLAVWNNDFADIQLSCRNHAAHFEKAKTAFEEGGGNDDLEIDEFPSRDKFSYDDEYEKASIQHISRA
jgi:SHS family lactate transporter-like MFS transporter